MEDQDDTKLMRTPADLINLFINKHKTVKVTLFEFYDDKTVVVKVKLKYWNKVWASLNSDYAENLASTYQREADAFAPIVLTVKVILVICD